MNHRWKHLSLLADIFTTDVKQDTEPKNDVSGQDVVFFPIAV